jgi:WD40 repeat protein
VRSRDPRPLGREFAMRTRAVVAVSAVVTLAACTGGGEPSTTPPRSSVRDVLVLDTAGGSVVLDTSAGSVLAKDPGAVVAPDGSRLYSATVLGDSTRLEARDAVTGNLLTTASVPGVLDVSVASLSGRSVAMTRPRDDGTDPWIPEPRTHSTIVVADPSAARDARTYRLMGNYEPEAFSIGDARLFLIQYLPAMNPSAYRVTFLDLASGRVHPVFGRFKTQPERMPGERLRQVFDAQTSQLYTLYTNRSKGYGDDYWSRDGDELTFVHVLNLRKGWAFCAGLPRSLWNHPASAEAMSPSPDGRILYIVDSMRGLIAEMDTRSLEIVRTAKVELGSGEGARTSAVTSVDGSTLFVSSSTDPNAVYAIDTSSLDVSSRWTVPGTVSDVGLSSDGARLYAALTDHVAVLDPSSGSELGMLAVRGVAGILHVETPGP